MDASFATSSPTEHRPFLLRPATALPHHALARRHRLPRRITVVAVGSTAGNPRIEREQFLSLPPPVPVPRGASSLAACLCNAWEDMVNKWLEPLPLRPSVDPEVVLAGNFAPVHELPPTPCPVVKGNIPHCLRGGAYVRNGPNPQHAPRGPHHLFDGDGMLHSLLLPAGRSPAVMCSRFVRTQRYTVEREAGGPVFPSFFTFRGLAGAGRSALVLARALMGQLHPGEGIGAGNVSLAFFHRRLFAFGEPDLPYAVHLSTDDGDVSTVGRANFGGRFFEGMTWFDVPGFSPMHVLNAWEEEGEGAAGAGEDDGPANNIVLVAPNMLNVPHLLEGMEHAHSCVEMLRIDLKNSTVTRTPLSVASLDMGVINAAYVGKKNRYAYLAMAGPFPKMRGVAKLDFELAKRNKDCVVACREYGPGCYGGEPFFVSKDEACGDEDDGYVVSYVHDENSGESRFVVMDAKSPELDVVAEVLLPRRVPYGFHGIFVRESELRDQQIL